MTKCLKCGKSLHDRHRCTLYCNHCAYQRYLRAVQRRKPTKKPPKRNIWKVILGDRPRENPVDFDTYGVPIK